MSQPRIAQVDRPDSLSQRAYRAIRQAVQDGELVRDSFYSESDLAHSMGISRTPVREALIELAQEGLVEVVPQRGFRLRVLGPDEQREVFELRKVLESYVVERLAREARAADVARLRKLVDRQARLTGDPSAFLAVDEEFHLLMPTLIGLRRTHQMLVTLRGAMWLLGNRALALPERSPDILVEHSRVVDAIEAGDHRAARQAIQAHVDKTSAAAAEARGQALVEEEQAEGSMP